MLTRKNGKEQTQIEKIIARVDLGQIFAYLMFTQNCPEIATQTIPVRIAAQTTEMVSIEFIERDKEGFCRQNTSLYTRITFG